jgi:PAS domain S-box-containing protein
MPEADFVKVSEGLLRAIIESSDDAIYTEDTLGTITSWNGSAERIYGYHSSEAVGRPISILVPPDRLNEEEEILERVKRGERIQHYETIRRRKDGSYIDVSLAVSPLKDSAGKVVGISKVARDITDQRRSSERLRRSEERFRITLASIGDGVITTDPQGRVTFMNPIAEKLTGWSQREAVGLPLETSFRIVNEVTRQGVENPVKKALRKGQIVGLANHTILISKQGAEFAIDDSAAPVREPGGEIVGVVLVFRDVTEKRVAEINTLRMAAIVESSDDAIISKSLDGIVQTWNKGAERIFGYTADEMIGKPITTIFPPERLSEEAQILQRLRKGERIEHFETVRLTKDGRRLDISLTNSPITDSEGRVIGASKIARDITAQKRDEQALHDAKMQIERHAQELERTVSDRTAQLRATIEELEAFTYSLSHDMRTPLRAMTSYAEIVLAEHGDSVGDEGREFLKRIARAAERMDRLIQDVLAFTRLSRQQIALEPMNVEKVIQDAIDERTELQPAKADILIEKPLLPVLAHGASLTQCVTNLLDNAVKFVAPGVRPRVRVWTEKIGDRVRLSVRDNGIGIDPDSQRQLFEMFNRVHSGNNYPGTGIGLAIVRKAVERMDGTVGVESELGKGSRFWLELKGVKG